MVAEDECRQERRQEKRKQVDQRVNDALLFVAKVVKKDAEKGGDETH
jgi:hypothetical protein